MITIVDYKAGNLTSVQLGFASLGVETRITNMPEDVEAAERVVFPGVGSIGASMDGLRELGLIDSLRAVVARGVPFLGICLGMQILLDHSDEDGGVDGIGIVAGQVQRFAPTDRYDKVPQMGWNAVGLRRPHPVFADIADGSEFYFVHSYYPQPAKRSAVLGETDYAGKRFASVISQDNVVATQFHPEKSGRIGLALLRNFSDWDGRC